MSKLTILSMGWGVQSWVLAAMAALGDVPPIDFAIHSDTTWERSLTYDFAQQWTPWLKERGVRVVTVNDSEQAAKVGTAKTDIPAFSRDESTSIVDKFGGVGGNAHTTFEGNHGQLRRQCTSRWKIKPMRRFISQELDRRGLKKKPGVVTQWLGITVDEVQRARDSDVKYIKHDFPLLNKKMNRMDCLAWLDKNGLPSPGKSACVFCPYQNRQRWQTLKRQGGKDWEVALMVDVHLRDKRPPYPLYVHPDRRPLNEAVIIPEDFGAVQGSMFDGIDDDDAECDSGYCFL